MGFLCNRLSCFTTTKITLTCILHMIIILAGCYTSHLTAFAIDLATLYCALKMEFTFRSKLNVAFPLNVITFRIDLVSKLFLLDLDIQDVNSALCV